MYTTLVPAIMVVAGFFFGVHAESKSLGLTWKQQREAKRQLEQNRLFWSIRDKEMEIYGRWLS
jgi:hypothetical protein